MNELISVGNIPFSSLTESPPIARLECRDLGGRGSDARVPAAPRAGPVLADPTLHLIFFKRCGDIIGNKD
ncbi:hypothetical protein AAY473_018087 [Plecturocebus cupreus]